MTAAEHEPGAVPHAPDLIRPEPGTKLPKNVADDAQGKKERPPSATMRYEARVDSLIAELKRDKQRLEEEVHWLRLQEIHHLREDVRWLEDLASWQRQELVKTKTSYESAIAFSWFAFALIAIGGCVVSYAAFVHPEMQQLIATVGLVGLFIGVALHIVNARVGKPHILGKADPPGMDTRPRPNPQPGNAPDVRRAP